MLGLAIIVAICYAGLLGIATALWVRQKNDNESTSENNTQQKLSLLIPFRNEVNMLENLTNGLALQSLDPSQWECIFIDDHSTDHSIEKLNHKFNFKSTLISSTEEGKKAAITHGIAVAAYDYIVQTDADSIPDARWLSSILKEINNRSNVVITGPVAIQNPRTLLDHFQSLDLMALMGLTYTGIKTGWWYMGNGANLTYPKSLRADFILHGYQYASGDDMFLIESAIQSQKYKVSFNFNPDAIIYTSPCPDLKSFIQQRLRWGSKNAAMKSPGLKTALAISLGYNIVLASMLLVSIFNHQLALPTVLLWTQKWMIDFIYLKSISPFFKIRISPGPYFLCSLIYPYYALLITIMSIFNRKYEWKGRIVQ